MVDSRFGHSLASPEHVTTGGQFLLFSLASDRSPPQPDDQRAAEEHLPLYSWTVESITPATDTLRYHVAE